MCSVMKQEALLSCRVPAVLQAALCFTGLQLLTIMAGVLLLSGHKTRGRVERGTSPISTVSTRTSSSCYVGRREPGEMTACQPLKLALVAEKVRLKRSRLPPLRRESPQARGGPGPPPVAPVQPPPKKHAWKPQPSNAVRSSSRIKQQPRSLPPPISSQEDPHQGLSFPSEAAKSFPFEEASLCSGQQHLEPPAAIQVRREGDPNATIRDRHDGNSSLHTKSRCHRLEAPEIDHLRISRFNPRSVVPDVHPAQGELSLEMKEHSRQK